MASLDKELMKVEGQYEKAKDMLKVQGAKLNAMASMDSGIPKIADLGIALAAGNATSYVDGVMSGSGKKTHTVTAAAAAVATVGAVAGAFTGHPTIAGASLDVLTGTLLALTTTKSFDMGVQAKLDREAEKAAKGREDAAKA